MFSPAVRVVFEDSALQQLIVQRFLAWSRSVSVEERAQGVNDLALAYIHGGLRDEERQEIETVLTVLLDDPSPVIRRVIAEAFADRDDVARHIVATLASDLPDIAAIVLRRSPLLGPAELVDYVGVGSPTVHIAIAERVRVPSIVAVSLTEHGSCEVALALAKNKGADLSEACFLRMLARFGDDGDLREAILAREDVPSIARIELVAKTARILSDFVEKCGWMSQERSERLEHEAGDNATLLITSEIAANQNEEIIELVAHLRRSGRLTAGLMMRALLCGERRLFEAALSNLSSQPLGRVVGLIRSPNGSAFVALYNKAAMPNALMPAFQVALAGAQSENLNGHRLSRKLINDVLRVCQQGSAPELASLAYRLRRLDAEAARQDVRQLTHAMDVEEEVGVVQIDEGDVLQHQYQYRAA